MTPGATTLSIKEGEGGNRSNKNGKNCMQI